ncbi:MAG: hypothetical protein V9E98_10565 [Candidatus Nanopelagicales bacterium]
MVNEYQGKEPLRVLHLPVNVADQAAALADAQRALGARCEVMEWEPHPFYPLVDHVCDERRPDMLSDVIRRARWWSRARRDFDVVHLHAGAGIIPSPTVGNSLPSALKVRALVRMAGLDVRSLRRAGVVTAVSFAGDDIRPLSDIAEHWDHAEEVLRAPEYGARQRTARRDYSLRLAARADLVYVSTPDLLTTVPRARLLPQMPSRPVLPLRATSPRRRLGGPLRVLHAPSSGPVKGTSHVREAMASAHRQAELELIVLSDVTADKIGAALRGADLVVDQLNAGWYGTFAVEAMWTGTPVMARIRSDLRPQQTEAFAPIPVTSDTLADDLVRFSLLSVSEYEDVSARTIRFVDQSHSPAALARSVLDDYSRVRLRTGS